MKHDELYDRAYKAVDELFSDTSVSERDAANSLRRLRDNISAWIETLEEPEDE